VATFRQYDLRRCFHRGAIVNDHFAAGGIGRDGDLFRVKNRAAEQHQKERYSFHLVAGIAGGTTAKETTSGMTYPPCGST
jgi:hypothetical protein